MIKRFIILLLSYLTLHSTFVNAENLVINNGSNNISGSNIEMICTTKINPVCDINGVMYNNSCLAGDKDTSFDYCRKPINLSDEKSLIQRAYDKGITKFNTIQGFKGSYQVTRAQAAKMLSVRGKLIYPEIGQTSKLSCEFSDIENQTSDLQGHITQACQLGLFQGYQGRFMPTQYITKGQLLIVLQRIVGQKYTTTENQPIKASSRQTFYGTAGDTANNTVDKLFFLTILAHSYNILSDSLSFNSSIW